MRLVDRSVISGKHFVLAGALLVGLVLVLWVPDQQAGNYLFFWWTAQVTTFAVVYGFGSPWRKTDVGRGLFYYAASGMILGLQGTAALLWAGYPGRMDVRQLLFLILVLADVNMLLTMVSIQRDTRRAAAYQQLEQDWYDLDQAAKDKG